MKDEELDRDEVKDDVDQITPVEKLAPADVKSTYLAARYAKPASSTHRRFHPWISALILTAVILIASLSLGADIIGAFISGATPVGAGSTGATFIFATLAVFGVGALLLITTKTQRR